MRRLLALIVLVALSCGYFQNLAVSLPKNSTLTTNSEQLLQTAFANKHSNFQVQSQGIVIKLLPDDLNGSKHQRFIIQLSSGQTLLIAHNIDLAPRINSLQIGDRITFFGEYEWNEQGGIVHWTHRDPRGHHVAGWIEHQGKKYQ